MFEEMFREEHLYSKLFRRKTPESKLKRAKEIEEMIRENNYNFDEIEEYTAIKMTEGGCVSCPVCEEIFCSGDLNVNELAGKLFEHLREEHYFCPDCGELCKKLEKLPDDYPFGTYCWQCPKCGVKWIH